MSFTLGDFFATKYMLIYGLPSALAGLDGIDAPGAPKCTARIHLYSQMWRDLLTEDFTILCSSISIFKLANELNCDIKILIWLQLYFSTFRQEW